MALIPEVAGYDLIGDIHGHVDELRALLSHIGYRESNGAWRHPDRVAIFVGDFIDRGPKIAETLDLVRAMLENRSAFSVLGNHEWNALAFHHPDPDAPGEFLRPHTAKNVQQHARTLKDVPAADLARHLEFFRTLPLRLELPGPTGFRVVHACWDEAEFAVIDEAYARHGGLTDDFLVEGSRAGSPLFAAIEIVLKGKEIQLPPGVGFVDKDGHRRDAARIRWFAPPGVHSLATYTIPLFPGFPEVQLSPEIRSAARPYPPNAPPVFFGHYWLAEKEPALLAPNVVCLDYSVAKGGFLCGYQWERGTRLDMRHFVRIDADLAERRETHPEK